MLDACAHLQVMILAVAAPLVTVSCWWIMRCRGDQGVGYSDLAANEEKAEDKLDPQSEP